jgi:RHS repeat-associated protein
MHGLTPIFSTDDQIETVTSPDPDGAGPLPRLVTTTFYDAAGRKQREVQPDGGEVLSDYWPTGELKSTSGARTYPVSYSYDPQGRLKTLTTRQGAAGVGEAVTTWNYSPTGLLANKRYQDNTGPSYTYSWAGRLATRQWARGITTTYTPNNAGEVAGVSYSDGTTPGVTLGYDRRGLPATIADASGVRTLTYTAEGQPDEESYTAGLLAGLTVDRGYDALHRRNALAVPALGASLSTGYGYDGASRLQTVTNGQVGATYTREPNSPLLASVAFTRNAAPVMTTSRMHDFFDRQLNQATILAGQGSAATAAGYAYNTASQRTQLTREDGSSWSYGYDALGQVTGGSRKWSDATPVAGQQFAYSFDQIGNRQSATVNGRVSSYSPNLLNQYASRTVPGAVDVQGSARPEAIVTVNGQLTARKGEYYAGTAPVNNTSAAVDAELKIVGVRNSAGPAGEDAVTEQTGRAFVPQTPESFTHDLDGNLTSDGRFIYTWDGENRLIAVEAHATTPATAKVKVTMLYDAHSRRMQKQVYTWNAGTSSYQLSATLRFLYDGWNLITELTASNQVVRSYAWGLDLSGSLQGAGGVGGLLALTDAATGLQYLPTYDGNGNVLALINAADGTLAAQYEYGPFGEPLRATGAMAKANPFRFSTHYTDEETGLVYAKRRYYSTSSGGWLSVDPIGEQGGVNLCGYVSNQPTLDVDPFGQQSWGPPFFPPVNNEPDPPGSGIGTQLTNLGAKCGKVLRKLSGVKSSSDWYNDPFAMFEGWQNGTLPPEALFGSDSQITQGLMRSPAVSNARAQAQASMIEKLCKEGQFSGKIDIFRNWSGYPDGLRNAVTTHNWVEQVIGGFSGTATYQGSATKTASRGSDVKVTVQFNLTNVMGLRSYNRHWEVFFFPATPNSNQSGPYRTFTQRFQWTEDLSMSCSCCP